MCCDCTGANTVAVISANLYGFHALTAIPPKDAPAARQLADDFGACVVGARASGHSESNLPAYVEVHQKLVDMLRTLEESKVAAHD